MLLLLHRNSGALHVAKKERAKDGRREEKGRVQEFDTWTEKKRVGKREGKECGNSARAPKGTQFNEKQLSSRFLCKLARFDSSTLFSLRLLLAEALKSRSSVLALGLIVKASLCQSSQHVFFLWCSPRRIA